MDDQSREWFQRRASRLEHLRAATRHECQLPLLGAGRASGERCLEVPGTRRLDSLVLVSLDVGVDRGGVHHDLAGPQGRERLVEHADHVG